MVNHTLILANSHRNTSLAKCLNSLQRNVWTNIFWLRESSDKRCLLPSKLPLPDVRSHSPWVLSRDNKLNPHISGKPKMVQFPWWIKSHQRLLFYYHLICAIRLSKYSTYSISKRYRMVLDWMECSRQRYHEPWQLHYACMRVYREFHQWLYFLCDNSRIRWSLHF